MEGNNVKWVRLGDYISQRRENNSSLKYGVDLIEGVNSDGEFQPTKAITDNINLKPYKVVRHGDIVYNPSRLNIGSLAYRTGGMCIVSHLYQVFHIKEKYQSILSAEFLTLYLRRSEFYRYVDYDNFASQRAEYNLRKLGELLIPLPSPAEQQKVVNAWRAFREIKVQNEAKAAPLMQLCQSYIQELKHKYPMQEIGPYLQFFKEKNKDNEIKLEQGINIAKEFITPQRSNSDLSSRIKVRTGQFAYCTQLNNENVAISLRVGPDCVVSPVYEVFEIKKEYKHILNSEYLLLWLIRKEFGRYVYWSSVGSAYEFLRYDNLYSYKIPLPPIEVQQAIVNIYKCANEAKRIAEEADRLSREVCPALLQHVIHS
ncbi:restriction endonuclease subunit S [Bacteroides gallinaceum]|uniref:restriction endonuclease subunit S n=1 Tax=Bacteroides gallinaceum TaxID=1462571 RepID=UPI0025A35609|nr:restriction endonuclease subunit S [Bacteroides gallinaceum]MDM8155702.1 restriction endonuclease subunit S [Bacteroides gallinaceum]